MKYPSANLATYAEQGCLPRQPSRSGINFTWAILVGLYIAQSIFMQALSRGLSRRRWELRCETIFVVFAIVVFLLLLSAGLAMLCDRSD